jgi:hypothetical protein
MSALVIFIWASVLRDSDALLWLLAASYHFRLWRASAYSRWMAIETFRRTVTTAATLLYAHPSIDAPAGDWTSKKVTLINASGTPTEVVLGGSSVTAATGARWGTGLGLTSEVELEPGEALYAIVASGTQNIDVLVNGR